MSDFDIPVIDPATEAARKVRSDAIKAGRAKAQAMREAKARHTEARQARQRDASDAAHHGIAAHPGPAQSAAVAREDAPPEVLRRVKRENRDAGWTDLPTEYKKPGWDYEYKTIRVLNEPVDPADFLEIRNAGWRPEKAASWPTLCEPGTPGDAPIERRGQRLYGRPMSLTMEARQEDIAAARQQQYDKTIAAASGQSAERGASGIPNARGVRPVPIEISIVGEAGA